MLKAVTVILLGLAGCCLSITGELDAGRSAGTAGVCGGPAPANHRSSAAQCQAMAPRGTTPCSGDCPTTGSGQTFACNDDAECDAGVGGRCTEACCFANSACTYDQCTFDSDCPADQTCACHGSTYLSPWGSTCVPSDCRVDADCGSGCDCSPSQQAGCLGCLSYHCHTPQDLCLNDSDCQPPPGEAGFCVYASDAGLWECTQIQLPEAPGPQPKPG